MPTKAYSNCSMSVAEVIDGVSSLRRLSELFTLCEVESDKWLVSKQLDLVMQIKRGGYVPKSGLILIQYLHESVDLNGLQVLDIGTGEVGLLAQYAKAARGDIVTGCDAELAAIEHAGICSDLSDQIRWQVSDVYSNLKKDDRFDVILSNPPQMPMSEQGTWHDYGLGGSADGRAVIKRIIEGAPDRLFPGGSNLYVGF